MFYFKSWSNYYRVFHTILRYFAIYQLPAEHGHGTEYKAPSNTQNRWKRMDPLNVLNPGIGGTSANYKYNDSQ